ncbi:MAG: hypothetical protein ABIG29_01075 [Candidatus Nealsonbacteria bacterium]
MLDSKAKKAIEDLVTSTGRQVGKINEDKEALNGIVRVSGNPENIDGLRRAILKMAEAEEALRAAESRLNNLL